MNCLKCGCLIWFVFLLEASCSDCPAFPSNECLAAEIISLEKSLTNIIKLNSIFNLPNPNKLYGFSKKDWKKLGAMLRLIPSESPLKQNFIKIIRLVLQAIVMVITNRHSIIDNDEPVDENDMLLENVMLSDNHDKILSRLPKNDIDEYFRIFEPKKKENSCKFEKLTAPQHPSVLHKVETTIDVVGALAQIIFGKRTIPKVVEKIIIPNLSTTTEAPVPRKDPNYDEEDSEEEDTKFFELMYEEIGLTNLKKINSSSSDKTVNISRNNEEISNSGNISSRKVEVGTSVNVDLTQNKASKNFTTDFRKSGEGVKDGANDSEVDSLEDTQSSTPKPLDQTANFTNKTDSETDVSKILNIAPRKRGSKRKGSKKIMKVSGATASNARKSMKIAQNNFKMKTAKRRIMGADSPTVVTLSSDEYDEFGFRIFTDGNDTSSEKDNISGNSDSRRANIESDNFVLKADDDGKDVPKRRVQKSENTGNEEREKELLYKWFFTKFKHDDARRVLQQIEGKEDLPVYDYNGTRIPYRQGQRADE